MIGEPDAGKPHVRFDEGAQETCDIAARLCPTLRSPQSKALRSSLITGFLRFVRTPPAADSLERSAAVSGYRQAPGIPQYWCGHRGSRGIRCGKPLLVS